MALSNEESEQRRGIAASLPYTGLSLDEVWLKYFTLGGQAGEFELQRDILAHAVNERLDALNSPASRAPCSRLATGTADEGAERTSARDIVAPRGPASLRRRPLAV
ncbi:hypothetical protein ACFVTM_07450 [Arthrobacter sp. NPDC058130]|uniref:hypothetical protein n=1 Tax=Arthrobacter sp. NPDC058130 TaxID=3346353 RepID=UPI0036EE3CEE